MKPSRILVIDDDHRFLELVEQYLKRHGWRVFTASDARQGLMEIRRNMPNVILADMLLRNSDGFQLVKSIKEDKDCKQIPVIAITGLAGAVERLRCFKAGCDDVLSKPFSLDELGRRLEDLGNY